MVIVILRDVRSKESSIELKVCFIRLRPKGDGEADRCGGVSPLNDRTRQILGATQSPASPEP